MAVVDEPLKYSSAENRCIFYGGSPVSIHSKEKNAEVTGQLNCNTNSNDEENCAWIGMMYNKKKKWHWTDGTEKNYTNWVGEEPSNMDDDPRTCVAL
ncbi:lectin C-type domain protein [Ancylostoma caninum]|uniref:Lectin C-type domain protein n=1 Tax=Ancylostoma caninum TaxID=29170 RepID=A0A368G284_ANCCA|nr:lectin C-type domain protein [Ancylostoma caninum]